MLTSKKSFFYQLLILVFLTFFNAHLFAQEPPCGFFIELGDDLNVPPEGNVELFLAVSIPENAISAVSWTPSATLSCDDCYDPIANPLENTCYIAMVTDTADCTVSDTLCLFVPTTSTIDLDQSETVDLFPNPASDILTIHSREYPLSTIIIFDALGRQVQSIAPLKTRLQNIPIAELDTGIYYLEINFGKYFARKKFVKIKNTD